MVTLYLEPWPYTDLARCTWEVPWHVLYIASNPEAIKVFHNAVGYWCTTPFAALESG